MTPDWGRVFLCYFDFSFFFFFITQFFVTQPGCYLVAGFISDQSPMRHGEKRGAPDDLIFFLLFIRTHDVQNAPPAVTIARFERCAAIYLTNI